MRWQEFKNTLVENKQQEQVIVKKAETHLDALVTGAKQLPDTDPVKQKVVNVLQQVNTSLQNFVAKIKGELTVQTTQPTVSEDNSSLDSQLDMHKDAIYDAIAGFDELYDILTTPEQQKVLEEKLNALDVVLYDTFIKLSKERKELVDQLNVATGKAKEVEDFFRGLLPLLRQLGNKVNDYTELAPEDLEAMSSTERKKAKSKAVNASKFAQTLAEAMSGKVLKLLSEGQTTTDQIKDFLQACLDGKVIRLDDMVKQNKGNIDDFVNSKYQKAYNMFVEENIFSYSPGATSGAIGPGELALAMLGDPASKADKGGDLYIGKGDERQLYEIKAGKGTSGGRMNSKKIVSATAGMPVWERGINKILKDAKAEGNVEILSKSGKAVKIPLQQYTGTTHNKTGKGYKPGSRYNFNPSGIGALNDDILKPYAEQAAQNTKRSPRDVTYQLFHDSFKALIGNWDEIPNADKVVYNAVKEDGSVDYTDMSKAYTSLAYRSYQLADEVNHILFIRTDTRHFAIIEGHDDFMSAIEGDAENNVAPRVTIGSGFTWNDDQQTPTPTYLSAKH